MRILHVDDNPEIIRIVNNILSSQNYVVDNASTPEEASEMAFVEEYDLIILDRRLGMSDGLRLCRELRTAKNPVPVLVLSVLSEPEQRVDGLDSGADDYLGKPFHSGELLARVRTLLRRSAPVANSLEFGDLKIDPLHHRATCGSLVLELLPKEFAILEYLVRGQGAVRTKTQIGENVWGIDFDPRSNIIESYISRLRAKLGDDRCSGMIRTIRGIGYALHRSGETKW